MSIRGRVARLAPSVAKRERARHATAGVRIYIPDNGRDAAVIGGDGPVVIYRAGDAPADRPVEKP